nr:hypothetical protein Iba_chr04eCG5640 [Ipomoea batatas]
MISKSNTGSSSSSLTWLVSSLGMICEDSLPLCFSKPKYRQEAIAISPCIRILEYDKMNTETDRYLYEELKQEFSLYQVLNMVDGCINLLLLTKTVGYQLNPETSAYNQSRCSRNKLCSHNLSNSQFHKSHQEKAPKEQNLALSPSATSRTHLSCCFPHPSCFCDTEVQHF